MLPYLVRTGRSKQKKNGYECTLTVCTGTTLFAGYARKLAVTAGATGRTVTVVAARRVQTLTFDTR